MVQMIDIIRTIAQHDWYLIFCMGLMILPMIWLSIWYHSNINQTDGGRKLMSRQNDWQMHRNRRGLNLFKLVPKISEMSRDISSGRYGDQAGQMQRQVYKFVAIWLLVLCAAFGLLIWAGGPNPSVAPL